MPRKSDVTAVAKPEVEQPSTDCPHKVCKFGHPAEDCGWCPECHPEVPEW